MPTNVPQIIDANINRVSEGLRVIEEYCRFVASHKAHTDKLASLRKSLNQSIPQKDIPNQLNSRHTQSDQRAKESPTKRTDIKDILTANFKRVAEGLRVLEEYTGNATYNSARYDIYDLEKDITLTLLKPPIQTPGVYLISHDPDILLKGIQDGASIIQLRAKDEDKPSIYTKATYIQKELSKLDIHPPFIINDHLDIAKLVDADGLHTGQDDIPIQAQRQLLGPHKLIGRTTHTLDQGLLAQTDGADYVSVGPIWDTPSKPNRPGIGFDYLKSAKDSLTIPYVAIGGINISNLEDILPHTPPLIGLIRDHQNIKLIQNKIGLIPI